jgi:hypothetical protein
MDKESESQAVVFSCLEEVVERGTRWNDSLAVGHSVEDLEVASEIRVQCQNRRDVSTAVAVVGSRPDCHQVLLREHVLVSFLNQLMCSADELQFVDANKLYNDQIDTESTVVRIELE